jgi:hypothetical protein
MSLLNLKQFFSLEINLNLQKWFFNPSMPLHHIGPFTSPTLAFGPMILEFTLGQIKRFVHTCLTFG